METNLNKKLEVNCNLHCPVCSGKEWYQTGTRIHKASDKRWKSGYPKIQKVVFFDIWHQNKAAVEMQRCVCRQCGFVIDLPRPDEKQVDNKYRYLAVAEKDLGSSRAISPEAMRQEHNQANEILDLAKYHLKKTSEVLDILDYGGGAGHFLIPMVKEGNNCFLVDYNQAPFAGVTRLGDTLADIPLGKEYDLIICRHVLEHVAAPKKICIGFKKYLKNNGLVYAEVPIELFGARKPSPDPVTHINYFQKESFRILFESAGFMPIISREKRKTYHGRIAIAAQILVRIDSTQGKITSYGKSFEETMLFMRRSSRIRMRHPLQFNRSIFNRLRKKIINKIIR